MVTPIRILVWLAVALACSGAMAATNTADSASSTDVQTAINNAAQGDTVIVPSGTNTWSTPVTISYKNLTLRGQTNTTVITRSMASIDDQALACTLAKTNFVTIDGFVWKTAGQAQSGVVYIADPTTNVCQFRVTRCKFYISPTTPASGTRGLYIDRTFGLIDHCSFIQTDATATQQGISLDSGGNFHTTNNFHIPQSYGDTNTVVIEDCTFPFAQLADGAFDMYDGMKVVFRNNTVTNTAVGWHGCDSRCRGPRMFEVYNNTFYATASVFLTVYVRGGAGVVWSNTITGTGFGDFLVLTYYRANPGNAEHCIGANADGSQNYDGNFDASGYPGLDQPGRGSFPASTPWATQSSYATNEFEALEGVYQWGNSYKGDTSPTTVIDTPNQTSNLTNFLKLNRDFFDNTAKPGYTPLVYPHPLVTAQDGGSPPAEPTATVLRVTTGKVGTIKKHKGL